MNGLDIETTALEPREGKIRLVQIASGRAVLVYDAFKQDAYEISRVITETCNPAIAHNATFEQPWLREHYGIEPALEDTMIMSQVLYTGTKAAQSRQFAHSLQASVKRELKREMSKEQQTSNWGAEALTREQIGYAALDAKVMPETIESFRPVGFQARFGGVGRITRATLK